MRNLTTLSALSIAKLKAGVARVAANDAADHMLGCAEGRNQLMFDDIWAEAAERAHMMDCYVDRAWQQDVLLEALLIEGETGLRTLFMCTDFESCTPNALSMQHYFGAALLEEHPALHSWMLAQDEAISVKRWGY